MENGLNIDTRPRTTKIVNILSPSRLLIDIDPFFFIAAISETENSGIIDPNETIVKPISRLETPKISAIFKLELTIR